MKTYDSREQLSVQRWTYAQLWSIQPWYTLGMAVCSLLAGLTPVVLFVSLRGLIDDQLIAQGRNAPYWLSLLLIVGIVEATVSLAHKLFRNLLREVALVEMNDRILKGSLNYPIAFFEQRDSQNLIEKIKSNSVERMVDMVGRNSQVISSIIQIVTMSAMLARIEPLVLLVIPPCFLPYLWYQLRLESRNSKEIQQRALERRQVGYFVGLLTSPHSVAETRVLGISDYLIGLFRKNITAKRDQGIAKSLSQFFGGVLFALVCTVLFVGLIAKILYGHRSDGTSLGSIVFFAAASIRLRKSLEDASAAIASIFEHIVHVSHLRSFLVGAKNPQSTAEREKEPPFYPEIRFQNVSFGYEGQDRDAIQNVSFTIHPGETIAIVGENGSGKSTLVKLIAGIYQPRSGEIQISGRNIQTYSSETLYEKFAFVFQDFSKYNASLKENLAYGNWKVFSQELGNSAWQKLEPSAQLAGLLQELQKMPEAQDTVLGKAFGRYEPSGGVWQRIALARAFVRNAPLLIMDEPTSAIDARAEYELFKAIAKLSDNRTTILISHRFSTVSMASRIFVMDGGCLVESGSHSELMSLNGRYAMLYNYHRSLHTSPSHANNSESAPGQEPE